MSFNEMHQSHVLVGDENLQNVVFNTAKTATMNTTKSKRNG